MQNKPIYKYLVTSVIINNNEVKFINPKIFDKGLLARKYVSEKNTKNEFYTIQEIFVYN